MVKPRYPKPSLLLYFQRLQLRYGGLLYTIFFGCLFLLCQRHEYSHAVYDMTDGVYGMTPDPADDFGVNLGTLAPKGEFGVLILGLEQFARMTSNPFFGYLSGRLLEGLPG